MRINISIMLMLLVSLFSGCSKDDPTNPPDPDSANVIWPLAIGNSWTFQLTFFYEGDTISLEYTTAITESVSEDGRNIYIGDDHGDFKEGLFNDSVGFHNVLVYPDSISYSGLRYKYPGQIGDSWTFEYLDMESSATIEDVSVSVTVPAGTFNCYEYALISSEETRIDYCCPGIGLIKSEFFLDSILLAKMELVGYTVDANSE